MEMTSQITKDFQNDINCDLCFIFHPKWSRILATRRVFVIVYSFVCILKGMGYFYMITSLTSIELHFQLQSKIIGIILSIGEATVIFATLFSGPLLGGNCHRPRMISLTVALMGIGYHLFALPYFIYGPPKLSNSTVAINTTEEDVRLCLVNSSSFENLSSLERSPEYFKSTLKLPEFDNKGVIAVLLLALTFTNIGSGLLQVIGTPFIDDNIENENSPMYIGLLCSCTSLGPVLGTMLGSFCLSIYVDPQNPPWFDANDNRWVGAWWIGFMISGCLSYIGAFSIAQFPRRLSSEALTPAIKAEVQEVECLNDDSGQISAITTVVPSVKNMSISVRRILVNPLLWFLTLSQIFSTFAHDGFTMYLPKYLELEFQMTSSHAGLWTGCSLISPTLIGHVLVGYGISHFKINIRELALANIIAKLVEISLISMLIFIRCDGSHLLGTGLDKPVCDMANCNCSDAIFSPVCGSDGNSYFSPCHAGCSESNLDSNISSRILTNCTCVGGNGTAETHLCINKCTSEVFYLIIVAFSKLGFSLEIVAGILFMLRSVNPQDKTLASGFVYAIMGIFVFVPTPITFSAVVDWSCLIWNKQNGDIGACVIYDMTKMRSVLHLIPIVLLLISTFWDTLFWHFCKDKVFLYDEKDKNENY